MRRVRDKSKLACAIWRPVEQEAVVTKVKGKYFQNVGYSNQGQCLFCEEAVFLVDRDEMVLVREDNGAEYTKAEVFDLLNQCAIPLAAYQAYSVLAEQRFRIFRHAAWQTSREAWKHLPAPRVGMIHKTAKEEAKRCKLDDTGVQVAYDVYLPQTNFSKTQLTKPNFSLVILNAMEPMPPVSMLKQCLRDQHEKAAVLRLCIVGDSSMSFIEVSDFDPASARNDEETIAITVQEEEEEEDVL